MTDLFLLFTILPISLGTSKSRVGMAPIFLWDTLELCFCSCFCSIVKFYIDDGQICTWVAHVLMGLRLVSMSDMNIASYIRKYSNSAVPCR